MPSLRKKTILAPKKTFLAFPDHYVNLPAFIKFANLQGLSITDGAGKKVIAAGTIVHMKDDGEVVLPTASLAPNGIIFDEIVVDDYDAADTQVNAAVMVHGFVRADRLTVKASADGTAAKLAAANPMINIVRA